MCLRLVTMVTVLNAVSARADVSAGGSYQSKFYSVWLGSDLRVMLRGETLPWLNEQEQMYLRRLAPAVREISLAVEEEKDTLHLVPCLPEMRPLPGLVEGDDETNPVPAVALANWRADPNRRAAFVEAHAKVSKKNYESLSLSLCTRGPVTRSALDALVKKVVAIVKRTSPRRKDQPLPEFTTLTPVTVESPGLRVTVAGGKPIDAVLADELQVKLAAWARRVETILTRELVISPDAGTPLIHETFDAYEWPVSVDARAPAMDGTARGRLLRVIAPARTVPE